MKKGEILEGIVEEIEFPNKGIIRSDGESVIVKNALPGQRIRFVINKKRGGRAEGRLLEVLESSALERTTDGCPHAGICGGCLYQSLPYEEQLKIKAQQVDRLIRPVCGDWGFEGIRKSPVYGGYRNKMEFSFGDEYKGGPLALGMHKRASFYDIVTTRQCRIVHEDFCHILGATLDYFTAEGVPYYQKLRHVGYLRHLLVRRAVKTGEILVALVTTTQTNGWGKTDGQQEDALACWEADGQQEDALACWEADGQQEDVPAGRGAMVQQEDVPAGRGAMVQQEDVPAGQGAMVQQEDVPAGQEERELLAGWKKSLKALKLKGTLAGILHIKNDSLADVVQSDCTEVLTGRDYFYEELLGLKFKITPFSFFQTNSLGAEVLYQTVREYVGETKTKIVFDLYSGTGTIAQLLSPVTDQVVGVEIVGEAVEAARENTRLNGLDNCRFIAGDVLKVVGELKEKPDLIILDPPRDGIHPKALKKIIDFGVERMIYVSCKPTSLARDLKVLLDSGYQVEKGHCVDMFPATAGIETVVSLSRVK